MQKNQDILCKRIQKYVKQKGASYKKRLMSRAFKIEKMIPEASVISSPQEVKLRIFSRTNYRYFENTVKLPLPCFLNMDRKDRP